MPLDLDELVDLEIEDLNRMVEVLFRFPAEVFAKHGTSAFAMQFYEHAQRMSPSFIPEVESKLNDAKASFALLCDSVPCVPKNCVEFLSLAYAAVSLLPAARGAANQSAADAQETLRGLQNIAMLKGMAMGAYADASGGDGVAYRMTREFLSRVGLKGAQVKHRGSSLLKEWAFARADQMKESDKKISVILAMHLPEHLKGVVENPERVIYEALLKRRRKK